MGDSVMYIRVPDDLRDRMQVVSREQMITISAVARILIKEALDARDQRKKETGT